MPTLPGRLTEHVQDKSKLPILIFPEGEHQGLGSVIRAGQAGSPSCSMGLSGGTVLPACPLG